MHVLGLWRRLFRSNRSTPPSSPSAKSQQRAKDVLIWTIALATATSLCLIISLENEFSGLRTIWRRHVYGEKELAGTNAYERLALNTFSFQRSKASEIFSNILQGDPSTNHQIPQKYDVCPVVLSTVDRAVNHWVWTTATLLQGHEKDYGIMFSPPTLLWRKGGALDQLKEEPFTSQIDELIKRGIIRHLRTASGEFMPEESSFRKMLFSSAWQENSHYAQQAFDHVVAMNDCLERKCGLCIILEDDVVLSSTWRERVADAYAQKSARWGVLKLFELEEHMRVANPVEGWESQDVPILFDLAFLGSSILTLAFSTTVLQKRQSDTPANLAILAFIFFVWTFILVVLMGHNTVFPTNVNGDLSLRSRPTSFRKSHAPVRGAVANVYKLNDLELVIRAVKDLIYYVSKDLGRMSGGRDRIKWIQDFSSTFSFSSDILRIDVIVAKYFMFTQRPILILEPNVVQHIGFISTEPLRRVPFTAMTSTFEDNFSY